MNYLAHILLSGDNGKRRIGGFIADFVKGSRFEQYPFDVKQGIILHRRIDAYTDAHEKVKEAKNILRPYFGRYSGIVLDIFYDHFLAKNMSDYAPEGLLKFTRNFYLDMIAYQQYLPLSVKSFAWHFIMTNRLYKYSKQSGVEHSLEIMSNYSSLPPISKEAIVVLNKYNTELEQNFREFFPDAQQLSADFIRNEQRPA